MRLLIMGHHSDSGFGVVTRELSTRFLAAGIDVRILAVNHRGEPVKGPLAGRIWPAAIMGDPYGGNISGNAIDGSLWRKLDPLDDWQADLVLVVSDMSGLTNHMGTWIKAVAQGEDCPWTQVPVFHYCPIEGDNLPMAWKVMWTRINPVAMSDYGAGVIGRHVEMPVPRVYHGVDTEVFRPLTQLDPVTVGDTTMRSGDDAKRWLGIDPNRKLVLRSDRLVTRKFYDRFLILAGLLFDADPDIDVLIHCRAIDEGLNLHDEIARMKPAHAKRLFLTNAHDTWKGLPTEGMAALMNAADLYVSTTGGEGFGLNLAESLACGTPVVVTDWAADRETVGDGGVLIPPLMDTYGDPVRFHSTYGMDWAVPDPKAFVQPVLDLLSRPQRRKALGDAGRRYVKRMFSWDESAGQFMTLFEEANGTARLAS